MNEEHLLIMVAGYRDLELARQDFAGLRYEVKHKRLELRGAVLVTKDPDGTPRVIEVGNHMGGEGIGLGVGVGALVGLFAPPMFATVAAGAVLGGLVGMLGDHILKGGLHREVAEALAAGTGVVIALLPPTSQAAAESSLANCPTKTTVGVMESTINSLEAAVAEEMNKVAPTEPATAP